MPKHTTLVISANYATRGLLGVKIVTICSTTESAYFDFLKQQVFTYFIQQLAILQVSSTLVAFLCNLHIETRTMQNDKNSKNTQGHRKKSNYTLLLPQLHLVASMNCHEFGAIFLRYNLVKQI